MFGPRNSAYAFLDTTDIPTDRPTNVYISCEISIEHPSVGARFARPINCIILIKGVSLVKVIRTIHNIYVCMYINIVLIYIYCV